MKTPPCNTLGCLITVCVVFILTTLPGEILQVIDSVSRLLGVDVIDWDSNLLIIPRRMHLINHSINFILYCVTGSVFRQTLVRLFTCHNKSIATRHSTQCPTVQQGVEMSQVTA